MVLCRDNLSYAFFLPQITEMNGSRVFNPGLSPQKDRLQIVDSMLSEIGHTENCELL